MSLHCAWQPGSRYHLRLDLAVLTDSEPPEPDDTSLHTVTFAQECLVMATSVAPTGSVGLDMEILSVAMDRSKGGQFALSFDSDQGGETTDDSGYIPILTKLVGGHLHFLLSPDGKMLRAEGINEWLARAFGDAPVVISVPRAVIDRSVTTNSPPIGDGLAMSNAPTNIVRKAGRIVRTAKPASPSSTGRGNVASTIRNFFSPDHFRQMLEFNFLPLTPVHVEEEWKTQGDTPITGRGRFRFDATSKFAGWQQRGETNSARIDLRGTLLPGGNSPPAGASQKKGALTGTLWIDPILSFPVTTILDKQVAVWDQTTSRRQGTNNVVTKTSSKAVHQNVIITLLDVTPIEVPGVKN